MAVYDFFTSRNNSVTTIASHVGNVGRLFYDDATGELRLSDGTTAGGLPIPVSIATESTYGGVKLGGGVSLDNDGVLVVIPDPTGRLIMVQSAADLPAPIGGVITLVAGKDYLFANNVDLGTDVLNLIDGTSIKGTSGLLTVQTSSASPLITTAEALELSSITFLNDVGPSLAATCTGSNSVSMNQVRFLSAANDTIGGTGAGVILNDVVWIGFPGGLEISGTWIQVLLRGCIWGTRSGTGTALTLPAGFAASIFNISETQFNMSTGQTGIDFDIGIVPTTSGQVNNCVFALAGTAVASAPGSADAAAAGWTFKSNVGILNTQIHGWENVVDSVYHVGNKLAIVDGVRTKLTIDALGTGTNSDYIPKNGAIWNSTTNVITPTDVGSAYNFRLLMSTSYDAGVECHLDLEIDIGGGLGVIFQEERPYLKGATITNSLAFSFPLFTLGTFIANGGTIYITPTGSDILCWDVKLLIVETFDPLT